MHGSLFLAVGRRTKIISSGCMLVLLITALSSALAPTITDGRYRAGDIEPGKYLTTQHGCDWNVEFVDDLPSVDTAATVLARSEPPGPRYYYFDQDPTVAAYVFTGGCNWIRVGPIPKVPGTSP